MGEASPCSAVARSFLRRNRHGPYRFYWGKGPLFRASKRGSLPPSPHSPPNALSSGKFLHDGQTFDSKGPYFPRRHMTRHLQFSGRTLSPKITDDSHRALCHRQLRDCIISPSELMASSKARWGGVGNLKGGGHLSRRQRPKAARPCPLEAKEPYGHRQQR